MTIDELLSNEPVNVQKKHHQVGQFIKDYTIAITAGNLFYTPIMAALEHFIASKPFHEVTTSRITAATLSLATAYPLTKFADYWQQKHSYNQKPWQSQCAIDISGLLIPHIPLYSAILAATSDSLTTSTTALLSSLPVVILSAYPYRKFLHQWRKLWNASTHKTAISE